MDEDLPSGRTSLRLPPKLRAAIDDEAGHRGITVTDLIIDILESQLPKRPPPQRSQEPGFFD